MANLLTDIHQFTTELLVITELGDFLLGLTHRRRSGQRVGDGFAAPLVGEAQGGAMTGVVGLCTVASRFSVIHFISDGGDFERMIEDNSFALTRMAPRLTKEKIDHIAKVDRGEKFAAAFTDSEMIERVNSEVACLKKLQPVAVLTGS